MYTHLLRTSTGDVFQQVGRSAILSDGIGGIRMAFTAPLLGVYTGRETAPVHGDSKDISTR